MIEYPSIDLRAHHLVEDSSEFFTLCRDYGLEVIKAEIRYETDQPTTEKITETVAELLRMRGYECNFKPASRPLYKTRIVNEKNYPSYKPLPFLMPIKGEPYTTYRTVEDIYGWEFTHYSMTIKDLSNPLEKQMAVAENLAGEIFKDFARQAELLEGDGRIPLDFSYRQSVVLKSGKFTADGEALRKLVWKKINDLVREYFSHSTTSVWKVEYQSIVLRRFPSGVTAPYRWYLNLLGEWQNIENIAKWRLF